MSFLLEFFQNFDKYIGSESGSETRSGSVIRNLQIRIQEAF
jgi:hypothetical protein